MSSNVARWFKGIFALVVFVTVLYFLSLIGNIVRLLVIAALLAYILDPVASYLEAKGLSRTLATTVIFFGILLLFIGMGILLVPNIKAELSTIREGFGSGAAMQQIASFEVTLKQKFGFLGLENLDLKSQVQNGMKNMGNELLGHFKGAVSIVTNSFIIPVFMFFFLKDGRDMLKRFIGIVPNLYFEFTLSMLHKTNIQLGGYIRGQFVESAIIGTLTGLALWGLNVKYTLLLAIFAGILNMVPFIGPIVGAVPAVILVFLEGSGTARPFYVALAFVIVQMFDNAVLKPVVVARMVSIHPIMVIVSVFIGGKFFGVMGMLLSIPVFGVMKVVAEELYVNYRNYRFMS